VRAVRTLVAAGALRAPCRKKRGCGVCGNAGRREEGGALDSDENTPKKKRMQSA